MCQLCVGQDPATQGEKWQEEGVASSMAEEDVASPGREGAWSVLVQRIGHSLAPNQLQSPGSNLAMRGEGRGPALACPTGLGILTVGSGGSIKIATAPQLPSTQSVASPTDQIGHGPEIERPWAT